MPGRKLQARVLKLAIAAASLASFRDGVLPVAHAQCIDDPDGMVATSFAGGCSTAAAAIGCDFDLSTLFPRMPVGSFLAAAEGCPVSCDSCPDDPTTFFGELTQLLG
jgi:hypothetical protein